MAIRLREGGGVLVATVEVERLDLALAPRLGREVAEAARGRRALVLDLSAVGAIDSSGLGALVGLRKRLGWALPIVLVGLRAPVWRMLTLTRIAPVFTVQPTVEDALLALGDDAVA